MLIHLEIIIRQLFLAKITDLYISAGYEYDTFQSSLEVMQEHVRDPPQITLINAPSQFTRLARSIPIYSSEILSDKSLGILIPADTIFTQSFLPDSSDYYWTPICCMYFIAIKTKLPKLGPTIYNSMWKKTEPVSLTSFLPKN